MDIAASVADLASGVVTVGVSIYTIVGKYRVVPEFVQQLQMDCRILHSIAKSLELFAKNSSSSADMEILREVSKELLLATLESVKEMLPEGHVRNFRSRIEILWNDSDFRAKIERIRDNRANITLLLIILQDNAATIPSNGSVANLPETTRLHDYLYGGGKEPVQISRLPMRQVTQEPEFRQVQGPSTHPPQSLQQTVGSRPQREDAGTSRGHQKSSR